MPRIGEQQTHNGVTGVWTGATWKQVPDQSASTEPGTFAGGFMKHLLEKEKPTVAALAGGALLAAPVIGGPAAAGIAAAGPALSEVASRGSQAATGDKVDPVGLGTLLNVASGPASVYGPGLAARGIAKGASAVASSPIGQKVLGSLGGGLVGGGFGSLIHEPGLGALIGGRVGYQAGPMVGAAAESIAPKAAAAADNLNLGKTFSELPEMFGAAPKPALAGLKSAVEPAVAATAEPATAGGLGATEKAWLIKNHYPADTIAKMEQNVGGTNSRPVTASAAPKSVSTAAPSMTSEPSQNPGELWPYQSDAVQAKIAAMREQVGGKPDLMQQFNESSTGPVKAGTPWYGDNGEIIGHTTDTNGSTGFAPLESPAAKMVSDINAGSSEGRMTMQGPEDTGGLGNLANETPHPLPTSPGDSFNAEYGMSGSPGSNLPPTMANDILARRLARLQSVFGGKQ